MSSPDELKSTPRYDRIVAASRQIAWDSGHTYVGVEHLFLAIVQEPDAVPTQVRSRFVPPGQVGAAVHDLITSEGWGSRRSDSPSRRSAAAATSDVYLVHVWATRDRGMRSGGGHQRHVARRLALRRQSPGVQRFQCA
jgi:hypothetical protein